MTNYQRLPLLAVPVVTQAVLAANVFCTGGGALPSAGGDAAGITQTSNVSTGDMLTITAMGIETLLLAGTVALDGLISTDVNGNGVAVAPGATATATGTFSGGLATTPVITNGGSGYTAIPTVTISGGGGTLATAVAVLTNGVVTGITITAGGSGYTSNPTVTIAAPTGYTKALARALAAGVSGDLIPVIKLVA